MPALPSTLAAGIRAAALPVDGRPFRISSVLGKHAARVRYAPTGSASRAIRWLNGWERTSCALARPRIEADSGSQLQNPRCPCQLSPISPLALCPAPLVTEISQRTLVQ